MGLGLEGRDDFFGGGREWDNLVDRIASMRVRYNFNVFLRQV